MKTLTSFYIFTLMIRNCCGQDQIGVSDKYLADFSSRMIMMKNGWNVDVETSIENDKYPPNLETCGFDSFYGYGPYDKLGIVSATFKGFGSGSLKYGNCGSSQNGFVSVFLNGVEMGRAYANEMAIIQFRYVKGDVISIQQLGTAIIQLHSLAFKRVQTTFRSANINAGCCVTNDLYHRRCHCRDISDLKTCQTLCVNDVGCKGFVMAQDAVARFCQLATTTKCPKNCWGPSDIGNIQPLNSHAKCGQNEKWNGGCMIKNVNCSSIQSLSECSNEPSCDVVGKDPWGQSCLEYVNDPRGVPPFCSCKRIGDALICFICFNEPKVCGNDYAFHSGKMLNDNAPANNPQECLSECKSWVGCKFWDFGDGFCRLRSSDGNGAEVAVGYVFGTGNCFFEREANYKKIAGKSCFNDKYESYYTLQDAKLACSSDPRCKAIYEDGCNDSEFFLCPESATFYDSWFSCIFEKERKVDIPNYENYRCTTKTCFWNMQKENIDWGYYANQTGDCKSCMKSCDEDKSCDAVECGSGYCSWWKNSRCTDPDIDPDNTKDSTRTCVKRTSIPTYKSTMASEVPEISTERIMPLITILPLLHYGYREKSPLEVSRLPPVVEMIETTVPSAPTTPKTTTTSKKVKSTPTTTPTTTTVATTTATTTTTSTTTISSTTRRTTTTSRYGCWFYPSCPFL